MTAPQAPRIVGGRYRVVRTLGAGAHGTVDLAEDLLNGGRRVAVKRLEAIVGAGDPEPAAEILRWMLHPSWAEILDEGRLDEHGRFQVSRYVPGHSLDRIELPRPVEEVMQLLEDGARVLRALHWRGLIHYDVTPGNWLREETPQGARFTLTDGGLASLGAVRGFARGSPAFMAPEVLEGTPHDHRADLYSLGLVAWRALTGRDPHGVGGAGEILGRRRRVAAPALRSVRPDAPAGLERILAALLERDPSRRPSDGSALLSLLAEAGWAPAMEDLRPEEAASAAEGGAFVGRGDALVRFRTACQTLASDAPPASDRPAPTDPVHSGSTPAAVSSRGPTADTVLLLHGPSGSGGTRLAQELAARARTEGIATLSLSAREGAADRRSILRRIADGLGGLLGRPILLGAPREGSEAAERAAAADARATEMLVEACEQVAGEVPFVLVIEDFSELPGAAKESLRVLVRHLLARSEHLDGRRAPRLLLVIDHGPDDPGAMLIPDSVEPRRPVVELPPLSPTEVGALIADRLPGIELPATDLEAIHRACGGLPRMLTALLSEGLRRRDVRTIETRWIWMVEALRSYRPARTLPPSTARALEAIDPAARDTLVRLSLLDDPATDAVAEALADNVTLARLVSGGLLTRSHVGDEVRYAPASRALRDHLREDTPEALERHRRTVLSVLTAVPQPDLVVDEARLRADLGEPSLAIERLAAATPTLSPSARLAATTLLADVVEAHPSALASASVRAHATHFLLPGPAGGRLADAIFRALPPTPDPADDETRIRLAEDAYARAQYARALSVVGPAGTRTGGTVTARASAITLRASVATEPSCVSQAQVARTLRQLRASFTRVAPLYRRLQLVCCMASIRVRFAHGDAHAAARAAQRTVRRALRARAHLELAEALNSLAICVQAIGQHDAAETALHRSARIRASLGDMLGAARTIHNLARLKTRVRAFLEAAKLLHQSHTIAIRYANPLIASQSLLALASLYDDQGNLALAYSSANRAKTVAERTELHRTFAEATATTGLLALHSAQYDAALECLTLALRRRGDSNAWRVAFQALVSARALLLGRARSAASRRRFQRIVEQSRVTLVLARPTPDRQRHPRDSSSAPTRERSSARRTASALLAMSRGGPFALSKMECPAVVEAMLGKDSTSSAESHRSIVELLLAAWSRGRTKDDATAKIARALVRIQERRGHQSLASRLHAYLANMAWRRGERAEALREAALATSAIRDDSTCEVPGLPPTWFQPHEFKELFRSWTLSSGAEPATRFGWEGLATLAYRLSISTPNIATGDSRLASALRSIVEIAARLQTGAGLEVLLDSLNDGARRITGAERACVVLVSSDGGTSVRVASPPNDASDAPPKISNTILHRVLSSRKPTLVHDVFADSELMHRPSVTSLSLRCALCVPLVQRDRLYGAMYADSRAGAGSFDAVDLEVLALFADHAAAAIETARLLADLQRSYADLRSAQDKLVRGERLRVMGELAGGVAHEFNNLLTAMLARLQLLGLEPLSPRIRTEIELVQRTALDAAEVVRRLQTFSRSQRRSDYVRVDIGEVCADVVEFLRPLWTTRRLAGNGRVLVHLRASRGHTVLGDPTELREVITNLLKNAIEAIEHGGAVTISTTVRSARVVVAVDDEGHGISPDLRGKLFTPFFTTKGDKGTGLGLCLSQQIVERHGGELALHTRSEGGTRAEVTLPLAHDGDVFEQHRIPPPHAARPPLSVLVADDDANVLLPLSAYLKKQGYDVRSATSGTEAIQMITDAQPEVLLCDIGMPNTSGIDVGMFCRDHAAGTSVILMTGRSCDATSADAHACGAVSVLRKPFTMRQVIDLLDDLAHRREPRY